MFTVALVPECFLSEENLEDVHNVQRCLEPGLEWFEAPLLARVHATDRQWWSIAWAELERGLMTTVSHKSCAGQPILEAFVRGCGLATARRPVPL